MGNVPEEKKPHDAFRVYMMVAFRAPEKVFRDLKKRKKTKGDWMVVFAFIFLAAFGGVWGGYWLDTNYINPPAQAYGVCAPPAFISGQNCFQTVYITETVSGSATVVSHNINAGTLLNPYGNVTRTITTTVTSK